MKNSDVAGFSHLLSVKSPQRRGNQRQDVEKDLSDSARGGGRKRISAGTYEAGDLRGIIADAKTKSIDPYRALLEADVIRNAAEFYNDQKR